MVTCLVPLLEKTPKQPTAAPFFRKDRWCWEIGLSLPTRKALCLWGQRPRLSSRSVTRWQGWKPLCPLKTKLLSLRTRTSPDSCVYFSQYGLGFVGDMGVVNSNRAFPAALGWWHCSKQKDGSCAAEIWDHTAFQLWLLPQVYNALQGLLGQAFWAWKPARISFHPLHLKGPGMKPMLLVHQILFLFDFRAYSKTARWTRGNDSGQWNNGRSDTGGAPKPPTLILRVFHFPEGEKPGSPNDCVEQSHFAHLVQTAMDKTQSIP